MFVWNVTKFQMCTKIGLDFFFTGHGLCASRLNTIIWFGCYYDSKIYEQKTSTKIYSKELQCMCLICLETKLMVSMRRKWFDRMTVWLDFKPHKWRDFEYEQYNQIRIQCGQWTFDSIHGEYDETPATVHLNIVLVTQILTQFVRSCL